MAEENVNDEVGKIGAEQLMDMTSDIVSSYVSNNQVLADNLPNLIRSVHAAIAGLANEQKKDETPKPAVPISRSVTDDYIICLEDGKKLKMLKRYLRSHFDMTPDDYRRRWNLPASYPMVAPNYKQKRSEFAKKIGLGRIDR